MRDKDATLNENIDNMKRLRAELASTNEALQDLRRAHQALQADRNAIQSRLKDELFELENMNLKYNQSLLFLKGEKEYIKQLNIEISSHKQNFEELTKDKEALTLALEQARAQLRDTEAVISRRVEGLRAELARTAGYLHPLLY